MRQAIKNLLEILIDEVWKVKVSDLAVEIPENDFGDYASNVAFGLAKKLKKAPSEIAVEISRRIGEAKPDFLWKVEARGGYINFFLSPDFLRKELISISKLGSEFGQSKEGGGKKVIIEYSQPNIAKPLHAGHLRNTVFGEAIARVHDFLGYETIRWNYLGDWGTTFGKVIAAYKLWGNKEKILADPIKELADLYVKFNKEAKIHIELEERGRAEFKKLEEGDPENRQLWQWFRDESLKSLEKIYTVLGIKFDNFIGESFYENRLDPLIDRLTQKGLATTGEGGALIVELKDLPPALIRKSDGASLYMTRDIANLEYRMEEYRPDKILYVVGAEQGLHFQQLFAIAKLLGITKVDLEHLKYGLVLGEDGKKLSTRQGRPVNIEEIMEKAVQLARKIVEEKNPALSVEEKENVARAVGWGALKYEMVKDGHQSNITFSWKKMLDFSGNSAPYLQYSYARLVSIIEKSGDSSEVKGYSLLQEKEALDIIKHLINFPEEVMKSGRHYTTNNLALYLYHLANLANRFYEKVRILGDENEDRKRARLGLIQAVSRVLRSGLSLLGIECPEKV